MRVYAGSSILMEFFNPKSPQYSKFQCANIAQTLVTVSQNETGQSAGTIETQITLKRIMLSLARKPSIAPSDSGIGSHRHYLIVQLRFRTYVMYYFRGMCNLLRITLSFQLGYLVVLTGSTNAPNGLIVEQTPFVRFRVSLYVGNSILCWFKSGN